MMANDCVKVEAKEEISESQFHEWLLELRHQEKREKALYFLNKHRTQFPELSLWLWYSFGTITILLQELIIIYPSLDEPSLTAAQSNRVCNALALMQVVAAHKETQKSFLETNILLYLYPFLHTTKNTKTHQTLRMTSLGVIGAVVKSPEPDAIPFLLSTDIVRLCLKIMDHETEELSKTKILMDDMGLDYICKTSDRFSYVVAILKRMVEELVKKPSTRLLKHIVRCYCRLSENDITLPTLKQNFPIQLKDKTFEHILDSDKSIKVYWDSLLHKLG